MRGEVGKETPKKEMDLYAFLVTHEYDTFRVFSESEAGKRVFQKKRTN